MGNRQGPSAALIIAIAALVVSLSGTAIAASQLMSGDKLIQKHSLSGNRLRNHTIGGVQVNLKKLGKVQTAKSADNAKSALSATNAENAVNAGNAKTAVNSMLLDGQPGSAYLPAGALLRSGLVTSPLYGPSPSPPQVTVLKSGALSLTASCEYTSLTGSQAQSVLYANSTEPNWLSSGKAQGGFSTVLGTDTTSTSGGESGTTITFDLETPSGAMLSGQATITEFWPSGTCGFTAFAVTGR